MTAERLKEIPLTDAELAGIRRIFSLGLLGGGNTITEFECRKAIDSLLATIDAKDAEIERLSSQAPLQVSDELVESCARALWEAHGYTTPWDDAHPEDAGYRRDDARVVLKAALAAPKGEEGSQTK
jgi:hypothetical protein